MKVREVRYEIEQCQEMYLNNPESEVSVEKLRELFEIESEFLALFDS
jgi:hypothetical protein